MWKVKIWIYSDDDFGFDETVFNSVEGEVREFYFEKREDAVKAILESFHSLTSYEQEVLHFCKWRDELLLFC